MTWTRANNSAKSAKIGRSGNRNRSEYRPDRSKPNDFRLGLLSSCEFELVVLAGLESSEAATIRSHPGIYSVARR